MVAVEEKVGSKESFVCLFAFLRQETAGLQPGKNDPAEREKVNDTSE